MHLLFVHRAFPAQFGRLALELTRRHGWRCTCAFEHLSRCPTASPEMRQHLELLPIPPGTGSRADDALPWPQIYGDALERARSLAALVRSRPDLRPDLVVGHGGLLPTLFLRESLACPFVDYCEYYFVPRRRDLTYRLDLPPVEPAAFFPRCINAATLVNLSACDAGYSPTRWQRQSFPARFHPKIEVHFDGLDTDLYHPRRGPRQIAGHSVPPETRLVTFVSRGLESLRGFDLFLEVARRIERERPDVLFVVAGEERTHYAWDGLFTGGLSFKEWAVRRGGHDLSRFVFLGHVAPEQLAGVLCLSDLHVYLTVPFVLSWSLLNALACGCVVLASDVEPVREVIEPGRNGLVAPLFDTEALAETALRVLADPAAFRPLGAAGRRLMEEKYGLEAAVAGLKEYFERMAATRR
jgi:glycosyltransferase involved in cell wall biosynthesis